MNKIERILKEYEEQDFRYDTSPSQDKEIKIFLIEKIMEYALYITDQGGSDPFYVELRMILQNFNDRIKRDFLPFMEDIEQDKERRNSSTPLYYDVK